MPGEETCSEDLPDAEGICPARAHQGIPQQRRCGLDSGARLPEVNLDSITI